jgi:6-phosphofructokinase 1
MAEGLLDALDPESSPILKACPRDEFGRVRYSHIELGEVIAPPMRALCEKAGIDTRVLTKNIGYELRCHAPTAFDVEYTRFLGYGAVSFLQGGLSGVMVVRDFDALKPLPLAELVGADGKIRSRRVDLNSDLYRVAQGFMVRSDESFHAIGMRCGACAS